MENQYYVGIDISKKTLDWAMFDGQKIVFCVSTENSAPGIKSALTQMKEIPGFVAQKSIFCMEHRGIYNAHILEVMHKFGLLIWLENSTQIKQAGGMQRGKSDSVDVRRQLCRFGDLKVRHSGTFFIELGNLSTTMQQNLRNSSDLTTLNGSAIGKVVKSIILPAKPKMALV